MRKILSGRAARSDLKLVCTGANLYECGIKLSTQAEANGAVGATYNALSSHVILVIDSGSEDSSPLTQAVSARQTTKYTQRHLFFATGVEQSTSVAKLRDWLQMKNPDSAELHYEEMLRLRSVIVDWNRVPDATAYCLEVRLAYPCLPIFALTEGDAQHVIEEFHRYRLGDPPIVYSGNNRYETAAEQLGEDLDRMIDLRYEAPYWDSLREYSAHPIISFHALPLGQSRSLTQSLTDFAAFYGNQHFAAETSLSTSPMDSLLSPHSTIRHAQQKAAYAFGASIGLGADSRGYGTRFSTNGTSTANAVVISAFVGPGDHVLMEQTAHISHYNAIAAANAKPVLLRPLLNRWGGIGPVPLETLKRGLRNSIRETAALPAAIILTNPTFDGLFYQPVKVVLAIHEVLGDYWEEYKQTPHFEQLLEHLRRAWIGVCTPECPPDISKNEFVALGFQNIVLLFDEAWSAKAYFHPRMIENTAMRAAWDLSRVPDFDYVNNLRVYATQSTHKSLSALRQGSMIHYRDPLMNHPEVNQIFEQAYRAHCTTSPSATIVASLDVARRQAQLEGALLIERCMRLAERFRERFAVTSHDRPAHHFYALTAEMMMQSADPDEPDLTSEECFLDPTHVTLAWEIQATGGKIRDTLLRNSIQVNKYTESSLLAIFNIGIDELSLHTLEDVLTRIDHAFSKEVRDTASLNRSPARLPPLCVRIHEDRDVGYWLQNKGKHERRLHNIAKLLKEMRENHYPQKTFLAASFVTPYPPGFPVLIPGQEVTMDILEFLLTVTSKEIFGTYRTDEGLSSMFYELGKSL